MASPEIEPGREISQSPGEVAEATQTLSAALWGLYHGLMEEGRMGVPARRDAYLDAGRKLREILEGFEMADAQAQARPAYVVRDGVTDRMRQIDDALREAAAEKIGPYPAGSPAERVLSAVSGVLDWMVENSDLEPTERRWAEQARDLLRS